MGYGDNLSACSAFAVAEALQGLCVQVLNFDTTLVLHAWKTLVKEVERCRAGLGEEGAGNDELGLSVLVQDLCAATTVTFRKCLELGCSGGGGQEFQRHLKACKHLLSLLLVLLRVSSREDDGGHGMENCGCGREWWAWQGGCDQMGNGGVVEPDMILIAGH